MRTGRMVNHEAAAPLVLQGVMALQNEDDIARAEGALCALGVALDQAGLLAPLELSLGGLSHFRNQARISFLPC